jgi:hypothetical protein
MLIDLDVNRPDGSSARVGELLTGPTLLILLRHLA